jgi:hypothetical protein
LIFFIITKQAVIIRHLQTWDMSELSYEVFFGVFLNKKN